eukprot:m.167431 g.167431  ORF g.167431 m.167431 type:complete len:229 (+) comp53170_c0_seq1:132-818(+)
MNSHPFRPHFLLLHCTHTSNFFFGRGKWVFSLCYCQGPLHERTRAISRALLGDDIEMDFDMLIMKSANTNTETPWHQDESYWLDMPDKRAVSCWVAIDNATVDNGCMWFGAGSHLQPLCKHAPAAPGHHVLKTDQFDESRGTAVPLLAGSCTIHHGRTLHYTRGNTTPNDRRAYIVNYRPVKMIEYSRERNYDHGRQGWENFDRAAAGDVYKDSKETIKIISRPDVKP